MSDVCTLYPTDERVTLVGAFRLKAEAVEWWSRWARSEESEEAEAERHWLVTEARERKCFAWPLDRKLGCQPDNIQRQQLSAWYRNAAEALELAGRIRGQQTSRVLLRRAYQLFAESISALMKILSELHIKDSGEREAHGLLREWAREDQTYIQRHMKPGDPADPQEHDRVRNELRDVASESEDLQERQQRRDQLLLEIRETVDRCASLPPKEASGCIEQTEASLERWAQMGLQLSAVDLGEALEPWAECCIPDGSYPKLRKALEYVRERIDNRREDPNNKAEEGSERRFGSVLDALLAAKGEFGGSLDFLPSAESSAEDSPYQNPDRVYDVLKALYEVTTEWRQRNGQLGKGFKDAMNDRGFEVHRVSPTSKGTWPDEYYFPYEGSRVLFEDHITLVAETCLSVHWHRHKETRRVVIGHCGRHLRNTMS